MTRILRTLWNDRRGATMIEYALMLALVAIVCVFALKFVGKDAARMYRQVARHLR